MDPFNKKMEEIFYHFVDGMRAISQGPEEERIYQFFEQEFRKQLANPTAFEPYHARIPEHTEFAKKFLGVAIDQTGSKVFGTEHLKTIEEQVKRGENVIFFSNHQIEPDPQVLQILLGNLTGPWMDEMIFVAGDRVTRDPVAVPMSLGCNLLCIYSKKYIDIPKEMKEQKLHHNKRTLKKMEELLSQGGKMIYVAPSGGRDRKDLQGKLVPSPFDPSSIELFYLISSLVHQKTHFYPLALYTYDILPPPSGVVMELGEERNPKFSPAYISIGPELTKEQLHVDPKQMSKEERRAVRCKLIYNDVLKEYLKIRPSEDGLHFP